MNHCRLYRLALLMAPLCAAAACFDARAEVLYDRESVYHHIRVTETDGVRYLSFDNTRGNQSVINLNDPNDLRFAYTRAVFASLAFLDGTPNTALVLGLGGGTIPRVMRRHFPDMTIDIVEIDADVYKVAKEFFLFEPDANMTVHIQDGRQFMRRTRSEYDWIVLDAYNQHSIPFHLTTREFFEIVERCLAPGGVAACNVWSPYSNEYHYSHINTLLSVFPRVYDLKAVGSGNHIFVAMKEDRAFTREQIQTRADLVLEASGLPFELAPFAATFREWRDGDLDARVLTDDFAPVDILRSQRSERP